MKRKVLTILSETLNLLRLTARQTCSKGLKKEKALYKLKANNSKPTEHCTASVKILMFYAVYVSHVQVVELIIFAGDLLKAYPLENSVRIFY